MRQRVSYMCILHIHTQTRTMSHFACSRQELSHVKTRHATSFSHGRGEGETRSTIPVWTKKNFSTPNTVPFPPATLARAGYL